MVEIKALFAKRLERAGPGVGTVVPFFYLFRDMCLIGFSKNVGKSGKNIFYIEKCKNFVL
jgi:hypothetical protein